MSGLKTLGLVLLMFSAAPVSARNAENLPKIFANCAGQLSAMVEHAWLMQDPRAEVFEMQRASFLDLLDTVAESSDAVSLSWRIEAKAAQAMLLREAAFGRDPVAGRYAGRRAEAQVAACRLMLLGG